MIADPCESIGQSLGPLFSCAQVNDFTRVRTPFLYPDGEVIDVYVREKGGVVSVTDLGETLRWLRSQSLSLRRSPRQEKLIQDACLNHNLELIRGMLTARAPATADGVTTTILRVSQGALRVADIWFTMRTRTVETVTDEVEAFLTERSMTVERGSALTGRSGHTWKVDFHVRTPGRSSLMYILSTGSRAAAKGIAEHVLAAWYDLNNLRLGPEGLHFVSLFDDTMDVWSDHDFKLLEGIAAVARWSRPDELADLLAA